MKQRGSPKKPDRNEAVIAAHLCGISNADIARAFGFHPSRVTALLKPMRDAAPKPPRRHRHGFPQT